MINTGSAVNFGLALVLVFGIAMAPAGGVTGSLFSMVFTPEVRYSGASVGYTLSQICGAAFAPLIATALFAAYGSSVPVVALPAAGRCDLGRLRAAAARPARPARASRYRHPGQHRRRRGRAEHPGDLMTTRDRPDLIETTDTSVTTETVVQAAERLVRRRRRPPHACRSVT